VKTYQYGCHLSVLSHHALGTAECDESYCIEGGHIWSSFRRGAGNFWKFNIFVTSVPGWRHVLIWEMGVSMALYRNTTTPRVFGVPTTEHSLLLTYVTWKTFSMSLGSSVLC